MNITTKSVESQVLFDESKEIFEDFKPKKELSLKITESFKRLSLKNLQFYDKYVRIFFCGENLDFAHNITLDGEIEDYGEFKKAIFCRDRLCPTCSWRRSRKLYSQLKDIVSDVWDQYYWSNLTLTVVNCPAYELKATISKMYKAFKSYFQYKDFRCVKGYFSNLEVKYNPERDDFHPHFHILLALPKSYYNLDFIHHSKWLDNWRKAFGDDNITQVYISKVKDYHGTGIDGALLEVSKYNTKFDDFLFLDDEDTVDKVVYTLSSALKGVRLTNFGGVLRDIHRQKQFVDIEADNVDLCRGLHSKLDKSLDWLINRYSFMYEKRDYDYKMSYIEKASARTNGYRTISSSDLHMKPTARSGDVGI